MAVRNIASKYLEALENTSPTRLPLKPIQKSNILVKSPNKNESPDLDDLARQMNIEVLPSKISHLRSRFDSPSATVSAFKISPKKANSNYLSPTKLTALESPLKPYTPSRKEAGNNMASSKGSPSNGGSGYEYLCRIQAIKEWLEAILGEQIPQSPVELISHIRNGTYLAKLSNIILPTKKSVYINDDKLEFRHTENINRFFQLLDFLEVPDLFRFELTDLYDAKDVPKVWYCLHAISHRINQLNSVYPPMGNLVGEIEFSDADIKTATRSLTNGHLPNFSSADSGQPGSPPRSYGVRSKVLPSYSPGKSDAKPQEPSGDENPFRETKPSTVAFPNFELESVRKPDLYPYSSPQPQSPLKYRSSDKSVELDFCSMSSSTPYEVDRESKYYTPELETHTLNIIMLQALTKGSLFRYRMFVDKIMLKSYDSELTELFSAIRGNMLRKRTVHRHRGELLLYRESIEKLQCLARGKISRSYRSYSFSDLEAQSVSKLQTLLRGHRVRCHFQNIKKTLNENESKILMLQSRFRSKDTYSKFSTIAKNREVIEPKILALQSIIRSNNYRKHTRNAIVSRLLEADGLIQLQAIARGGQARNKVRYYLRGMNKLRIVVRDLQSIARGGILRTRLCNNVLITLMGEDAKIDELFAKVRGNKVRRAVNYKKAVLDYVCDAEIVPIQSIFRGILYRFNREEDLERIYEKVDEIVSLQSKIRANFVKSQIKRMNDHYQENISMVIKAQSILKSKYTQNAYKALIHMKNPPLSVVRKFAHLLSDSGSDYQEEAELSNLKDQIFEKSKKNEELELQIENLDIKLGLLDKNKITIEDFMKNSNRFKAYKPITSKTLGSQGMNKLSNSAKKRLELYLSMLYFLQTKSSYWTRLFENRALKEKDKFTDKLKDIITLIYPLQYGSINTPSRVEYFFLKFVCSLMEVDIKHASNVADITKMKSAYWIDYLLSFNSHVYQRMHLKKLIGNVVAAIIDDDELSFESDPSKIYDQLREQEVRTYGKSDMFDTISAQEAIKDPRVSDAFVKNLMALRDSVTDLMEILRASIPKLPLHIRIFAKKAYTLSQLHFPDQGDRHHLAVAGAIFIKHYIGTIFHSPENFGLLIKRPFDSHLEPIAAENLKYMNRALLQVFSMRPFNDNFMKPLNDYVTSSIENTRGIIREIVDVKDLETEYEMNEYDDIVSHERPQLTMKVADMISIEKLIRPNIDMIAPSTDDQLHSVVEKLSQLAENAEDFVSLTELGNFTLTLSPVTKEDTVADSKSRTLFSQAKRCLLYIIRVEEGDDLLELFIHGIKPVHEATFKEIIASESDLNSSSKVNPYRSSYLGDVQNMSYVELKMLALKVIILLERLGQVTRKDSFQELLNQIVVDIKTKDTQRTNRVEQTNIAKQTIRKLEEKERFLKRQLNDYNKHIDDVLSQLQLKPKEKKIFNIIPVFSKQYFYHRQLKKSNRLPKFGAYKYSAKKLMDQDIIEDLSGELQQKFASSSKLHFMFSCHKQSTFVIEAADGLVTIPGACATISLDEVLDHQYEKKKSWEMFNGMAQFNTENLATLIFRKFYDIKRD